ncbi:MAG: hypothetical protein CSA58_10080 [Micrococcales bacterium]|nr:MAG: hypothetical protein CSA58_10080 [Micrococcales bacterium]
MNFDPTDPMNSRGYSDSRRSGFYGKRRAGQGATDWERVDPNAKDPDARAPKPDVTFAQGDFDYSLKDHTSTRNINGVDVTSSATVGTRGGGSLSVGDGQLSARGQLQAGVEASTAASYSSGPVSLDADARVRAGFMASGEATIGKDGFHTQGEAFFGVKADANLSADIGGVRGTAGVEAWAGAGVEADVDFGFQDGKFTVGGKLGAGLGLGGADIGGVRGTAGVEAWAGAGVEADVDFGFQDGKFTVGGKLGAGLGLGGAVSGGVTIDVAEVGDTLNDVGDAVGEAADDAREAAGKVWDAVTPW